MDVDFLASRVFSAARVIHRLNSDSHYDDLERDDDTRTYFPCPFCYVEIEINALCSHLQEEHCFDLKYAVCPLCAANLGKDVIGHFIVQHASSLKHRRKSKNSGFWPGITGTLGKELSSFLASPTGGSKSTQESPPDPFLFPFLCSLPASATKDFQQDKNSANEIADASSLERYHVEWNI
ncbi:hypothetical protein SLA2020_030330 [Shorea laevis]